MARTAAGDALTEAHRRMQLQIRARALRDFQLLWPLWKGDEATFQRLLAASLPVIRGYHAMSSSVALRYYDAFRMAEAVDGRTTPRAAPPLDEDMVRGTLHIVGATMARKAILAGHSPQAAMRNALVRTSGSVTRFALAGGRDTLLLSGAEDQRAQGWARVTGGDACAFCAMLASRGASYLSESTAEFEAHDHCSCTAEIQYEGAALPPDTEKWRRLYTEAQREGDATGTANDALTNLRRHLSRQ